MIASRFAGFTASAALILLSFCGFSHAQEAAGPQAAPPAAVAPPARPALVQRPNSGGKIVIPAGTHLPVILENGISSRSAKPGDGVYFRTNFPVTQDDRIVIPVGCYMSGEIIESKRPGHVSGKGEFRLRLNTLIFPNGYTVNLNAIPQSADTGGKDTVDSEGKVTGPGGQGKDVGTVAETTATGAGIGAIAGGGKGAGIGAGIGGLAGLAAVLLTRGPEAEIRRGSTLDLVLERDLALDADKLRLRQGIPAPVTPALRDGGAGWQGQ